VSTDTETKKPLLIQIDDLIREMTNEEHEALLATGWTMEPKDETPSTD
jgi:hypothetical protein